MKNKCNIVKDILPLYVENMISDDTHQFVDEHVSQCAECKKSLELLKTDMRVEKTHQVEDAPVKAINKIRFDMNKKKVIAGIISAVISIIVVVLFFAYLTAPEYLPYTESPNIITARENNGIVTLSFKGEYELSQRGQGVYDISLYNTAWNKLFGDNQKQTIAVNPNGEEVNTIYYISNSGQEDKVIYGENPIADGRVITLPRLFLNYYFFTAISAALLLGVFYLIFRKKEKAKTIIAKILFMPLSYILSHIMIKGWNATSYSATRDFFLILLLTIPIYIVFYILYKKKSNNTL